MSDRLIRTRTGLRIAHTVKPTLMPNTQQWNVPGATDVQDTYKFSGSIGPNVGQDKTFTWALIKTAISAFLASTFAAITGRLSALEALTKTNPTYVMPVVVESVTAGQQPGRYEYGTVIGPLTFAASLQVNDSGGPAVGGGIHMMQNGSLAGTNSPLAVNSFALEANNALVLQANISFLAGAVKNDSLGQPYPTGQIQAGTANGSPKMWQGDYAVFYGALSGNILDFNLSSQIRGSSLDNVLSSAIQGGTINTGTDDTYFMVALPPNRTLASVVDLDALSVDITSQYALTVANINDLAGNAQQYNIYRMHVSIPYSANHRHQFTLN
jgi:hypothetical protein